MINRFEFGFHVVPSLNAVKGRNYHVYDDIRAICYRAVEAQLEGKQRMKKCVLKFTEFNTQPRDIDNLAFGLKYLLDAIKDQYSREIVNCKWEMVLQEKRLIPDDSYLHVLDCRFVRERVNHLRDRKYVLEMEEV